MIVEAQVDIKSSRSATWAAIADIENAAAIVKGIVRIEIVEKPAVGLVGLRWRETRILFDEEATVEKWVTEAVENTYYTTRAESHGFIFEASNRIVENAGGVTLVSAHDSRPQSLVAWVKMIPMGLFFKGVIRKALLQDLNDIKAAVE
jgi:hypothetical protein